MILIKFYCILAALIRRRVYPAAVFQARRVQAVPLRRRALLHLHSLRVADLAALIRRRVYPVAVVRRRVYRNEMRIQGCFLECLTALCNIVLVVYTSVLIVWGHVGET